MNFLSLQSLEHLELLIGISLSRGYYKNIHEISDFRFIYKYDFVLSRTVIR